MAVRASIDLDTVLGSGTGLKCRTAARTGNSDLVIIRMYTFFHLFLLNFYLFFF